jgi:hypothetical protein
MLPPEQRPDESEAMPANSSPEAEEQLPTEPTKKRDIRDDAELQPLYSAWWSQRVSEGKLDPKRRYFPNERSAYLQDMLRWLIACGKLDPRKRLPSYERLGVSPFGLNKRQVARVIDQLRTEGLLPKRIRRKDADEPQWTTRDDYLIWLIGQMRALRLDQVQRLLARLSEYQIDNGMLSVSQTSRIVNRWVKKKYAVYRRVYVGQPGWIYLTARGLYHAGLDFRAEEPSNRIVEHIFWINEVRLKIEEENPAIKWISEREIAAQRGQLKKGQRLKRTPDAILVTESEEIDIEIQISRPSPQEVREVMGDAYWSGSNNPLHYYVNRHSGSVVHAVYEKLVKGRGAMRPRIEIVDLQEFLNVPSEHE